MGVWTVVGDCICDVVSLCRLILSLDCTYHFFEAVRPPGYGLYLCHVILK